MDNGKELSSSSICHSDRRMLFVDQSMFHVKKLMVCIMIQVEKAMMIPSSLKGNQTLDLVRVMTILQKMVGMVHPGLIHKGGITVGQEDHRWVQEDRWVCEGLWDLMEVLWVPDLMEWEVHHPMALITMAPDLLPEVHLGLLSGFRVHHLVEWVHEVLHQTCKEAMVITNQGKWDRLTSNQMHPWLEMEWTALTGKW